MKKRRLALFIFIFLVVGSFFTPLGSVKTEAATWRKNNVGWWWQEDNGRYPVSIWKRIGGIWYAFDQNGYMRTGWYWDGRSWYYLGGANDGAMKTGWQKVNGEWYYLNADGRMATGWQKVNGTWYYMYGDGHMASNTWIGNYWVDGSGAWTKTKQYAQWIKSGNRWWYRHEDGSYTTNGFENIGGKTYYFDGAGWMTAGWQQINGSWYYFGGANDGSMKTGWINDGKKNYYLMPDGKWKSLTIAVVGNNNAESRVCASKVSEMGMNPVLVTGSFDAKQCDGMIIPGGGDLDPSRYGQSNTASKNIDNALDERQIAAVRQCAEVGTPVLGICKGIQLINVAFGGTLHQDIGGHMGTWHKISKVSNGWFSAIYPGVINVLSYHHQSLDTVAPGFTVEMRAADGTVEAFSNASLRIYGVQFHPEQMNNEVGNTCIKHFLVTCID